MISRRHAKQLLAVVAVFCTAIVFLSRQNEGLTEAQGSNELKGVVSIPFKSVAFCSSYLPQNPSSASSQNARETDFTKESVCRKIGDGRTAASTWRRHLHGILEASIHPMDTGRVHRNWTKELLDVVTPELMERALRTQPSYKDIDRIIQIIDKRLHNSSAPALQVGVFGGSVTQGSGCEVLPKELQNRVKPGGSSIKGGKGCAWPNRLQQLADSFLGKDVVQIHNLAVGGTASGQAEPVMSYWLYPSNSPLLGRGPDMIVNAYSTNDNLPHWKVTNATVDFDHFHGRLKATQSFIQTALRSRPCHDPPVVYYVDEYIGNQHELLLGEYMRHDAVQLLSNQAKFGYISSALAAQPLVHADTRETLFSALWEKRGRWYRDVHFGMPGHIYVSWVFAYSVLKAAADFCVDQQFHDEDLRSSSVLKKGSQTLVQSDFSPDLTNGVSWGNVTSQWNERETDRVRAEDEFCRSSAPNEKPCQFAFVATPAGTAHNARELNGYIKPFTVSSSGWAGQNDIKIGGWQNKLGLVADKAGASIIFEFKNIENSIRFLTLDYLKSYGEKWANSTAQFNITVRDNSSVVEQETSFRVKGYHGQSTSISSSYHLDLGADSAKPGRTVTLQIALVGGTMFKIIALMLCSR